MHGLSIQIASAGFAQ